jgi:hypothetical protein
MHFAKQKLEQKLTSFEELQNAKNTLWSYSKQRQKKEPLSFPWRIF